MISSELEIVQGDSKTFTFTFTENNVPVDVTGWKILFTVKENYTDTDANAKITVDVTAPDTTDSSNGIIYVPVTPLDTNIALGEYFYDFKVKRDENSRETIALGKLRINNTVTIRNS